MVYIDNHFHTYLPSLPDDLGLDNRGYRKTSVCHQPKLARKQTSGICGLTMLG